MGQLPIDNHNSEYSNPEAEQMYSPHFEAGTI